MSCPTKTHDNYLASDAKQQEELNPSKETSNNTENGTPPIPLIPDDDVDEGEEGFPLITSVFSLASDSSCPQTSPDKEATELTSSKGTSTTGTVSTSVSSPLNEGNISPRPARVLASSLPKPTVDSKGGPNRDNAPYYVGKGKLILPKPTLDENKGSLPKTGMAFSQMMNISPQNYSTTDTANNISNGSKGNNGQSTGMMKIGQQIVQGGNAVPGVTALSYQNQSISASSTSQPQVLNLANTVQLLNVKGTQGQASFSALVPSSSSGSALSSSVLSSSSPLMKLIKSITANSTVSNVPTTTVVTSTHSPLVTPAAPTPGIVQVRPSRHINIAPAPSIGSTTTQVNTTRYVVVPKTAVATPTIPTTKVASSKGSLSLPRVVMLPKTATPQGTAVTGTPVLYLVGNQSTGDAGKTTYRLFIPEQKAVQNPGSIPPQKAGTVTIVSTNNGNALPTQLLRIIPKPAATTVANQQSLIPSVPQVSSNLHVVESNVKKVAPIPSTGIATEMTSTSPPLSYGVTDTRLTADKSTCTISASSASSEEDKCDVESLDAGLSPHEARIQKLKELLRTQEEAVDRLRQKRQKEIEDIRSPTLDSSNSDDAASKRDSPFAVPLPPKKARLEHYRNKLKETSPTAKDGFLPNSDDNQFVKLVGLEKVVDKLKAKKMQELKESKALT